MTANKQNFQRMILRAAAVVLAATCLALGGFAQSQEGQQLSTGPKPEVGETVFVPRKTQLAPAQPEKKVERSNHADPWQAILAAKTVAVIGMGAPGAKRAKEQTEISLRKWGRFTLVEDPTKADLVVVARESSYVDNKVDETWAQLRVFKGPVTPAFVAQVGKRLSAQLRRYKGPSPLEEESKPLWEGWRSSEQPEVKNPTAPPIPSLLERLMFDFPQAIIEARDKERHDEELRAKAERDPLDPQVSSEVAQSIGDAAKGFKDLIGKTAKELDTMVAEDFCKAVAEAEKPATPSFTMWTVTPGQPLGLGSVAPPGQGQVTQEAPLPPVTSEKAKQGQPNQRPAGDLQQAADTTQVRIPDGTAVHVVVKNPVSSESAKKEDMLEFVVAEPVIVDGVTVIAAGTLARGMVVQAKKSTERKDGLLAWTTKDVSAADGTLVPLRLLKMPGPGGKKLTAGDVAGMALGLALMPLWAPYALESLRGGLGGGRPPRGSPVEAPAGERFLVFVNGDVTVATKRAPVSEPRVAEAPASPAVTATKETPKPQERWSFLSFDPSEHDHWAQFFALIGKAAADGYRLVAACDKGLLLEKAASPPELYRYRLLRPSNTEAEAVQPALNQGGALGYRWWQNTLGEAPSFDFFCVMEKAPGRPNQFQYVYSPEPGNFESRKRYAARLNQWLAKLYREGYREGYYITFWAKVLERAAEVPPPIPMVAELDLTEPYLWLPELLPPKLAPEERAALESLRGLNFEKSSREFATEIRAAAARGYRVVHCRKLLDYDCLLAKPAKPAEGICEYESRSVEPAGLNTLAATLNEVAANGYRLHSVLNTLGGSPGPKLEVLLEKDPQGRGRYLYAVFTDKTAEGLLGAMNAAAEQGYALRKFTCSARPADDGRPQWFAIMGKPFGEEMR